MVGKIYVIIFQDLEISEKLDDTVKGSRKRLRVTRLNIMLGMFE